MRKILTLCLILSAVSPGFAQDLGGKLGLGVRGGNFGARYFPTNSLGTELVTSLRSITPETGSDTTLYYAGGGAFYNRPVAENVYLQAGGMLAYSTGVSSNKTYGQWYLVPFYAGAEVLIAGHFGIDFRVHPAEIMFYSTGGQTQKSVWSLFGSLGAHYYF